MGTAACTQPQLQRGHVKVVSRLGITVRAVQDYCVIVFNVKNVLLLNEPCHVGPHPVNAAAQCKKKIR